MEVLIHLEKENGDLCLLPSKANPGTSAQSSKGSRQSKNAKSLNVPKALRKALGNVNVQVHSGKPASTKVQGRKLDNLEQQSEKYPEIETFIPYNPLEYERFDVPEEHKLSDRSLAGVPLFISMDNVKKFDALTNSVLSPMENELINFDSYKTFTPLFEDITIDLPLMFDF
ncbi:securin-like [Mixophyes fleayi]|uniref:securin-like n=1 Tax=Mixophyes fleayi TaxID=3061075 RepID=UPI003F4D9157